MSEQTQQPPATKRRRRVVLGVVAAVVVVVIGVAGWFMSRDDPDNAKVGSCITGQTINDLKVVDCAADAAEYKVVKRLDSQARTEFQKSSEQMCESAPSTTKALWIGKGLVGFVLCLAAP